MEPFQSQPRWLGRFAAALILVFLVQAFLESRYKSVATDEPPHIASGLSYLETGIFKANLQHPPLIKELAAVSMMIGGIRWPRNPLTNHMLHDALAPGEQPEWMIGNQIIAGNGADRMMMWARAPMLLVAGLLAAVVFLWGRQLAGGWAAVGAVFLCTMDPTILGHSYLVTTDIGIAAFLLLFLWALWNYVEQPSRRRLGFCGLSMGVMLCAKYSAVLMVPVAAVLLAASAGKKETAAGVPVKRAGANDPCPCGSGKKYKKCHGAEDVKPLQPAKSNGMIASIGPFLAMCLVALLVIEVVYLFSNGPGIYWSGLSKVNADHRPDYPSYLAGELQPRFLSYFAVAWLLKEPLASVVLTGIGLWALFRKGAFPARTKLFLLVPAGIMFLGATFLAADWGIRYIMPVLPVGHLLGGIGLAWLLGKGSRASIAAGVLCLWVAVAAFGVYPDRLPYFNESACLLSQPGRVGLDGGTRCGPLWLDDSNVDWGQSLKQLKTWLDAHAPGRPVVFAGFISYPPSEYGIQYRLNEDIDLKADPRPGLYAISATRVARVPSLANTSDWLRRIEPAAIVGHSIYVYDIAGAAR